jgi:hypothetical protein
VAASGNTTASELKGLIQETLSIPRMEQRLVVGNRLFWGCQTVRTRTASSHLLVTLTQRSPELAAEFKSIGIHYYKEDDLDGFLQDMYVGFKHATPELHTDKELVMTIVGQCGLALECASASFKADPEVVLEAVRDDARALTHASACLTGDKEFAVLACKIHGHSLLFLEQFKGNWEVVQAAVGRSGSALIFADPSLQADPEMHKYVRVDTDSD